MSLHDALLESRERERERASQAATAATAARPSYVTAPLHEEDDDPAYYSPPSIRPLPTKPLLVPTKAATTSRGGSPVAHSVPALHAHRPSMSPQASPPRGTSGGSGGWAIASPIKTATSSRQASPIVVGSVPVGSFVPPARPVFLSSTPPVTFEELRLAQRQASPARIHSHHVLHQQQQLPSSPSVLTASIVVAPAFASGADGEGRPPPASTPSAADSAPPLPSSVALASISTTSVPSARDELRLIWRLGYPVAFTILMRVGMAVTDIAMLGHKDTDFLAGAASALIWQNITSAFLYRAFGSSLNTLCSQSFGAGNFKLVGWWLQLGLLFSSLACVLVGVSWWWTEEMLRVLLIEPDIAALAGTFAKWSLLWLPAQIWMEMLQRYFQAQKIVFPALMVNAVFMCVNALLNLLLIFGIPAGWIASSINEEVHAHGWPGLGFIGSPIATAISRWLMLASYFAYTCLYRRYHAPTWTGWALSRTEALHPQRVRQYLLQQCLPNAIGVCIEEWQLQIVAIFATRLGSSEIATHNAMLELFFFVTSFMFGLVTAVQVRIGTYLGAGNALAAKQVGWLGLKVSVVIGLLVGGLIMATRSFIGHIFSSDPDVWRLAQQIAILAGAAYVLLSIFYTAMGVLNGQGRPLVVALAFLVGCWFCCIPATYVFAFTLDQGLIGLWYGLCCGYLVVTAIVGWRSYHSNWQECAAEAQQRAEMKKQDAAATTAEAEALKRSRRLKRAQKKARRNRAQSLNGASIASTVASDSIQSSLLGRPSQLEDVDSASDSGYSSCVSDEWNTEEVEYREEQLRLQRQAATAAAANAALEAMTGHGAEAGAASPPALPNTAHAAPAAIDSKA